MRVLDTKLFGLDHRPEPDFIIDDKKKFLYCTGEILELLNGVYGDYTRNVINDRTISLKNKTACPCYNKLKVDGCAVVEELINDVINDYDKRFTASFISCSKDNQQYCELLMKFV